MTQELSQFQAERLEALEVRDNHYRALKRNARRLAIEQAQVEIFDALVARADAAAEALEAGIPKSTIYQFGLHTTDAKTLEKMLELHRSME